MEEEERELIFKQKQTQSLINDEQAELCAVGGEKGPWVGDMRGIWTEPCSCSQTAHLLSHRPAKRPLKRGPCK